MKNYIFLSFLFCLVFSHIEVDGINHHAQQIFPKADLQALSQSAGSSKETENNVHKSIQNAKSQLRSSESSGSFSKLPSSEELDAIVMTADSITILKTIQAVANDDSIDCGEKVNYLLELLGKIKSAAEKKQFSADRLKIIIEGAEAEIERLEKELQRLEEEKKSFWLSELRDKLAKLVQELQNCYQEFNAIESQIAPNEARVAGFEKEIEILMKSSDAQRNRIANDRIKLTEVDALINDLQAKLLNARNRRISIQNSIKKSQMILNDNENKIRKARDQIDDLQAEIRTLRDQADLLRAKCTDLEIQVERLRTDISVAEVKINRIDEQISNLEDRLNAEKQKLVKDDLKTLNEMVESLNGIVGATEREIDRQFYYCYGDGAVQVEETDSVIVYIVRGQAFANYLIQLYGQSAVVHGTLHLYNVNIFSPAWKNSVGEPFASSSYESSGLSLTGDFSCLNNNGAVTGSGKVERVGANTIVVNEGEHKVYLNLGACSRIESTERIPKAGQAIAFKAVPSSAGGFNLLSATCW